MILASLACLLLGTAVQAAPIIVNEYNCVASGGYLAGDTYKDGVPPAEVDVKQDLYFSSIAGMPDGRIEGNGGNWIELVIVDDHVDIRNWELRWAETDNRLDHADGARLVDPWDPWYGDETIEQGIITFSDAAVWSDLRAGTILTISEKDAIYVDTSWDGGLNDRNFTDGLDADDTEVDVTIDLSTDLSFAPAKDDWWLHVSTQGELAKEAADRLITTITNVDGDEPGDFSVGPDNWQVNILNGAHDLQYGPIGEDNDTLNNGAFRGGLSAKETAVLEADLDSTTSFDNSNYNDRTSTTFGGPNEWDGHFQVFSPVRAWFQTPADWLATNPDNPSKHLVLVSAAVGEQPVPGPALFEFANVDVASDVTVALVGSTDYLADLDTTLGREGLLYEAVGGLFDAFTFNPVDPADSYELFLWDDTEGWRRNAKPIVPGTEFIFDTAQSDFLIWGVEVDPLGIAAEDFVTDVKITSTTKGPANVYVTPIPEPSSLVILASALLGLLLLYRRR
ncbi:MAG TPA: hypothetical protein VE890_09465 [Thermoguttaceae bacterium]|nr:hypothetical protein [Thermoguttaceae bacterium]